MLRDLQQAFIKYIKDEVTWELLNIIANKHSSNLNSSSAIYKMNTNLDRVFSDYIYYEVKANNITLAANIYSRREPFALVYEYTLDRNINCSISISKNSNSQYFKNITAGVENIISIITGTLAVITALIFHAMFLRIKDIKSIERQQLIYHQIKNYHKIKKKITTQSHNYFMSTRQQIMAIPLIDLDSAIAKKEYEIDLTIISMELKEYAEGYMSLSQNSATIHINHSDQKSFKIWFNCEIFYQIMFSILCNILYFVKNLPEVNISIIFDSNYVEFRYNQAFPVNEEILKINSDPVILNEIFEPFVIGFGSIFEMLERLSLKYMINHEQRVNVIRILLSNVAEQIRGDDRSSIIDITKRLKNKSKYES